MKGKMMINDLKKQAGAGYDALAAAVVLQACFDYVDASVKIEYLKSDEAYTKFKSFKKSKNNPAYAKRMLEDELNQAEAIKHDVERFFFSQWFEGLCELEPAYLISVLKEKVDERVAGKKTNASIRLLMKKKGVSQEKLSKVLGVSQTTVYTMLKNELSNKEKKRLKEIIKKYW